MICPVGIGQEHRSLRKVTVHGQARGTDPFLQTNGALESDRVHGRCLFFAVKMRLSPTRERLPAHGSLHAERLANFEVNLFFREIENLSQTGLARCTRSEYGVRRYLSRVDRKGCVVFLRR
jgi:hypothetical protein